MKAKGDRGLFITFEGTEGAGKSTLIRATAEALSGSALTLTREPGGSPTAERIRELILKQSMDPWCELFLYEAARAEHLATTVRPALERGEIVLCDRYTDSSLAYQAHARGLDWKQVVRLNSIATQGLKPHLTVFIDIDPARGLARAQDRNRFEEEGIAFQARVRQGFLKSKKEDPQRWLILKAENRQVSVPAAQLAAKVVRELKSRFPKHFKKAVHR